MKVSICCAYFNRAETIPASLESLLNQDFDSYEIIIVNDGSTDPEVEKILNSYSDPRLKVIHQANSGFVCAIRHAIENASGEYIAIHGAGDISEPTRIRQQADTLDNNPLLVAVSCHFNNTLYSEGQEGSSFTSTHQKNLLTVDDFLEDKNPFGHGEVMFRHDAYLNVGGYRKEFCYAQDRDLWLRLGIQGDFAVIPKLLYRRYVNVRDGVSTDRNKLLVQQFMSNLARQCYNERKKYGFDFIDKYGEAGFLFRNRSKPLAKFLAKQSLETLYQNNIAESTRFLKMSFRESVTLFGLLMYLTVFICKTKPTRKIVISILSLYPKSKFWKKN